MTLIVAELGLNHGGDLLVAHDMIRVAKQVGCDAVKVQNYRTSDFLPKGHKDWGLFEKCEIRAHLRPLREYAHSLDLQFGTTPSSIRGVREAKRAGVDFLKCGSDQMTHHSMIEAMLSTGIPTWVSCGMATKAEIEALPDGVHRMLCTSLYPCPASSANVARMRSGLFDGYSDHTVGIAAATAAVALGAKMVEKHFTLSRKLKGSDHAFSADPPTMRMLVRLVRAVERTLGFQSVMYVEAEEYGRENWRTPEGGLRR